jgi:hypothetical protein
MALCRSPGCKCTGTPPGPCGDFNVEVCVTQCSAEGQPVVGATVTISYLGVTVDSGTTDATGCVTLVVPGYSGGRTYDVDITTTDARLESWSGTVLVACADTTLGAFLDYATDHFCCANDCVFPDDCTTITINDGIGNVTLTETSAGSRQWEGWTSRDATQDGRYPRGGVMNECNFVSGTHTKSVLVKFTVSCSSVTIWVPVRPGGSGVEFGYCYEDWFLVGGAVTQAEVEDGLVDCDSGFLMYVALGYAQYDVGDGETTLDCADPPEITVTPDYAARTGNRCPTSGFGCSINKTEDYDHPLAMIYGTTPTFTVTWC